MSVVGEEERRVAALLDHPRERPWIHRVVGGEERYAGFHAPTISLGLICRLLAGLQSTHAHRERALQGCGWSGSDENRSKCLIGAPALAAGEVVAQMRPV